MSINDGGFSTKQFKIILAISQFAPFNGEYAEDFKYFVAFWWSTECITVPWKKASISIPGKSSICLVNSSLNFFLTLRINLTNSEWLSSFHISLWCLTVCSPCFITASPSLTPIYLVIPTYLINVFNHPVSCLNYFVTRSCQTQTWLNWPDVDGQLTLNLSTLMKPSPISSKILNTSAADESRHLVLKTWFQNVEPERCFQFFHGELSHHRVQLLLLFSFLSWINNKNN